MLLLNSKIVKCFKSEVTLVIHFASRDLTSLLYNGTMSSCRLSPVFLTISLVHNRSNREL